MYIYIYQHLIYFHSLYPIDFAPGTPKTPRHRTCAPMRTRESGPGCFWALDFNGWNSKEHICCFLKSCYL